jgi:phage-related protein
MPLTRPLTNGLSEVRTNLTGNRIARVFFFVEQGRIGVVHGFIKKTRKTPKADLDLALGRMKEMLE